MGAPVPIRPACLTPEELEKVDIPDPRTASWMPEYREMMRLAIEKNQKPYPIIPGGFISTTAPMLVPMETFMIWLMEAPDLAHKALSKTAEFGISLVESFVEDFGNDTWYPFEGTPTDSNVLIDPNMFAEFPLRYAKRLNEKIVDMGLSIWIHWCSDHSGNMKAGHVHSMPVGPEGFINMGPEVPMDVQAEKLGDKYRLVGNINPPLIMSAEFDEWQDICLKNIEEGTKAKMGYALGVGCELPPPAPPSNVFGMVKAAEEYGRR